MEDSSAKGNNKKQFGKQHFLLPEKLSIHPRPTQL
jgi:hypothetical protein